MVASKQTKELKWNQTKDKIAIKLTALPQQLFYCCDHIVFDINSQNYCSWITLRNLGFTFRGILLPFQAWSHLILIQLALRLTTFEDLVCCRKCRILNLVLLFLAAPHAVLLLQEGVLVRHHSHQHWLLNLFHALLRSRSLLGAALLLPVHLLLCTSPIVPPVVISAVPVIPAVSLTATIITVVPVIPAIVPPVITTVAITTISIVAAIVSSFP